MTTRLSSPAHDAGSLNDRIAQLQGEVKRLETLLSELHHRARNNLQAVSSLLTLEFGHLDDDAVQRALADSQLRIQAMAASHELLQQGAHDDRRELQRYLATVATAALSATCVNSTEIDLSVQADPVLLEHDDALRCGLIVNELVSNCGRHAFEPGRRGTVRVSLEKEGSRAILKVEDDGQGLSSDLAIGEGVGGLALVAHLAAQLGGRLDIVRRQPAALAVAFPL